MFALFGEAIMRLALFVDGLISLFGQPQWAMVGITAVYSLFSILTWLAIRRQANVAARNAEAFMFSHRAQLAAAPHDDPARDLASAEPRVRISIENVGATTAYDLTYESWIELLSFPFEDFTGGADHFASLNPCAIYPKHQGMTVNVPIRAGLTQAEREDMLHNRRFICIRVLVNYTDVFGKTRYADRK